MRRRLILRITIIGAVVLTALLVWANWPICHPLAPGVLADRIVVLKSRRRLELYANGKLLKSYKISLGRNPAGHKQREGDKRTPEGHYFIESRRLQSSFHRSLRISYPSEADRLAAQKRHESPGCDILIHGISNGLGWIGRFQRFMDWTAGCIAVTNPEIEEIFRVVPDGTPIEILP